MDLLSQDCDVLMGFVDHFCLTLLYKAVALVDYVEEITYEHAKIESSVLIMIS